MRIVGVLAKNYKSCAERAQCDTFLRFVDLGRGTETVGHARNTKEQSAASSRAGLALFFEDFIEQSTQGGNAGATEAHIGSAGLR